MPVRLSDIDLKVRESAYFLGLMARSEQLFNAGAHVSPITEETRQRALEFGFQLSALLSALRAIRTFIKRTTLRDAKAAEWFTNAQKAESRTMKAARLLRDMNIHDQSPEVVRRVKFDNTGEQPEFTGPHLAFHKNALLALDKFKGEGSLVDYLDGKSIMEFARDALEEHMKLAVDGHNRGFYGLVAT